MRRAIPVLNILLFAATAGTTLLAGGAHQGAGLAQSLVAGLPFASTLLTILLAHEMGHYVAARLHRVEVTLPYFIPVPAGFVGTLGAFIRIRSPIPSSAAALDIGAAGPLAGFAVGLPLLLYGFALSEPVAVPAASASDLQSPLTLVLAWLQGRPIVSEAGPMLTLGDGLLTAASVWLTHGALAPGTDLNLHPVAFASWIGMYITALNLIPVGQLDGGHILYAVFGRRAEAVGRAVRSALLVLGLTVSWTWLVWWAVVHFAVGVKHPPALYEHALSPARRGVALLSMGVLALTFVPVPFAM